MELAQVGVASVMRSPSTTIPAPLNAIIVNAAPQKKIKTVQLEKLWVSGEHMLEPNRLSDIPFRKA